MALTTEQCTAIANANTHLSGVGLPTYGEMLEALRLATDYCNHPEKPTGLQWFATNEAACAVLDRIPVDGIAARSGNTGPGLCMNDAMSLQSAG